MRHRALAVVFAGVFWALAQHAAPAQTPKACERDIGCWQALYASECSLAASTLETCLVFLQQLETTRRRESSTELMLLLGETLQRAAQKNVSPAAKERYLERARSAYQEAVKKEPFKAAGYLGLAEVAESGEERVEWLRGAVRAEYRPVDMERLAGTLSAEIGGHAGNLEAADMLEQAYTFESLATERWRYGASALAKYQDTAARYPLAASGRSAENVVIRIADDIDYALLQRALLEPRSYLTYLSDAFATLCEKSIAAIFSLDECMTGLEATVSAAESGGSFGARRLLAEGALTAMRTIAGESLPQSPIVQRRFLDWLDRLLLTEPAPVEVSVNLLEARADYTADLQQKIDLLRWAIGLSPNRGDLRLRLGATYVQVGFWPEALEQLRVAEFSLPDEEQGRVDELVDAADEGYQAQFLPPKTIE